MISLELSILDFIQTHIKTLLLDEIMVFVSTVGNAGAIWIATSILLIKVRKVGFFHWDLPC